jgi:hypothetical protein
MADKLKSYISQLQVVDPIMNNSNSENNSAKIIQTLFRFRQQLHVYHWQTPSYARHKASDQLLHELTEFIDEFMETYFGKYGKVIFSKNINISIGNMDDEAGLNFLDEMVNYYINELPNFLNPKTDTDLLNLKDTILGNTNQIKYLYTLK